MATQPAPARPRITEAEFALRMRDAGLAPSAAELAEMYRAYGHIEEMARRVRTPRSIEAEPATIFAVVDRGG